MKYPEDFLNKIICGDCLEIMKEMPDKCVDLVLTDPPYGIKMDKAIKSKVGINSFGKLHTNANYHEEEWDDKIPCGEIFDQIFRISKNQIICGGNYFTEYLRPTNSWIFWDKKVSIEEGDTCFSDGELIWTSLKFALKKFTYGWIGFDYINNPQKDRKQHPTQKPLELIKYLIDNFSKESDLILDPFLGSGTTARACKDLKRNFIGIEISPKYVEIARQRLRQDILL